MHSILSKIVDIQHKVNIVVIIINMILVTVMIIWITVEKLTEKK